MLLGLLLGKLQARPLLSMLAGGAPTILWQVLLLVLQWMDLAP